MNTPYEEKIELLRAFFVDKGEDKYADEMARAAAEAIGLREMMEALEPFAALASVYAGKDDDKPVPVFLGHLRHARKVMYGDSET